MKENLTKSDDIALKRDGIFTERRGFFGANVECQLLVNQKFLLKRNIVSVFVRLNPFGRISRFFVLAPYFSAYYSSLRIILLYVSFFLAIHSLHLILLFI